MWPCLIFINILVNCLKNKIDCQCFIVCGKTFVTHFHLVVLNSCGVGYPRFDIETKNKSWLSNVHSYTRYCWSFIKIAATEEYSSTIGGFRSRKWKKDRQQWPKEKKQRENNELQNTVKKTKYRVTRTPTENRD
jgi:hypothetical protein